MRVASLLILCMLLLLHPARAQSPASWRDDLVDHVAGTWIMTGTVMGKAAHHEVQAEWVLNHQFLRIHEKTMATAPKDEHAYEAIWFLGYDSGKKQYVMHLMDIFGAPYSETLGYGAREGDEIRFVFDYPDGPFHTTFRWNSAHNTWQWLMEQKDKSGKWAPFADLTLAPAVPR